MVYGFVDSVQAPPDAVLGVLASAFSVIAFIPYFAAILKGDTRPERAGWFLWSVLGAIAFASQIYEGATQSLGFVAVQVGGTIMVSLLSIWRGYGRFWTLRNVIMFIIAGAGIALWVRLDTSAYALAITISISLMGGAVTVIKAYRAPGTETLSTWVVFLIASVCAVGSVSVAEPLLLAYPLYLVTLYGAVLGALILGQRRAVTALPFRSVREGFQPSVPAVPIHTGPFWLRDRGQMRARARATLVS